MPRAEISKQNITDEGLKVSYTAADAANGMEFQNSGNDVLVVSNSNTASMTVTIDFAPDQFGRDGSKSVTVPAGEERLVGTFSRALYNQGTNGNRVHVDFSSGTSVNVAVISV